MNLAFLDAEFQPAGSASSSRGLSMIGAHKDIPIGRCPFETTELFRARFDELARRSGNLDTRFYLVEVTFEALTDPVEYGRFADIPTSFVLSPQDVEALRLVAGRLLRESPDYRRLLHDLDARAGSAGHTLTEPSTDEEQ